MDFVDTPRLLGLLGKGDQNPEIVRFFEQHRIHDRPKTVEQLQDEGVLDEDDDSDVEYELEQMSIESRTIDSERYGLSLIFKTLAEYELIYGTRPDGPASFVLEQIVLYAKGIRGSREYQGQLPGGIVFGATRQDARYRSLGPAFATRSVYDADIDLYVLGKQIVNFGFGDGRLIHVHVRNPHSFDRLMFGTFTPALPNSIPNKVPVGVDAISHPVSSAAVQDLLADLGINEDDLDDGNCPEEITRATQSLGITLYFRNSANGPCMAAISYKRKGDIGSSGYDGALPMGFVFGDTPPRLVTRAGRSPDFTHKSDQLLSYFWRQEGGEVVQAISSLIDWQLYRVTVHAKFVALRRFSENGWMA